MLPSTIKNKEKRSAVYAKLKQQKRVEKRRQGKAREAAEERAVELGQDPPPRPVPKTIENTREPDETICRPDDEELFAANDADEFTHIFTHAFTPKILLTTSRFNSTVCPSIQLNFTFYCFKPISGNISCFTLFFTPQVCLLYFGMVDLFAEGACFYF